MWFLVIKFLVSLQLHPGETNTGRTDRRTLHGALKMKFYTKRARVATIHRDISGAKICFNAASKGQNMVDTGARPTKRETTSTTATISTDKHARFEEQRAPSKVDSIALNTRFDKDKVEAPNGK